MAKVKITGHASGTGVVTVTAPNTSTDRTITLPDATATLATTAEAFNPDAAQVFNESGADVDFRVESDTVTHALFVDGATGAVGLGTTAGNYYSSADNLVVYDSTNHAGITIASGGNGKTGNIYFADGTTGSAEYEGYIQYDHGVNSMEIGTNHATQLTITSDGRGLSQFTAKAWVNFNGTGTIAINDSHNVSSLTDINTGNYRVNFSNAMANANYSFSGAVGDWDVVVTGNTPNTAYAPVNVLNVGSHNQQDKNYVMIQVFGD